MEALILMGELSHAHTEEASDELGDRSVRLVFQLRRERGTVQGVIREVARQLGMSDQSLRGWVKQADIDSGQRPGTTSSGSWSWNGRTASCASPMRSAKAASAFLRGSSIRDFPDSRVHRHTP